MNTEPINPAILKALNPEPAAPEVSEAVRNIRNQTIATIAKELRSLAGNPGMQSRMVTMQNALQIIANRLEQQATK